ncbi:MAG: cupin domain-containing protein [Planctomycetales bacterium]|nr:cupin domain-containing protein [Planctomycetales bacterium]
MAISHAKPAEVIDIRPLGAKIDGAQTTTLVKTDSLEVIRLVLPAGKEIKRHQVPGEITVLCLEGNIAFQAGDAECELTTGKLIYLAGSVEHALRAIEDSSLLVTILLHKKM